MLQNKLIINEEINIRSLTKSREARMASLEQDYVTKALFIVFDVVIVFVGVRVFDILAQFSLHQLHLHTQVMHLLDVAHAR